ncbi:MAG TPA: CerR family C-terminal domain-containing protein [Caldimonas sp.]|nr:CerR family C-terminal domain-containing protein [Caldimonas sp.]
MNSDLPDDGLCVVAQSFAGLRDPGEPARERLLLAALRLFAEQGYAKTSIRQIAQAAGANVAAVSYYFGNKAGLYRAVFWGGATPPPDPAAQVRAGAGSLESLFEHILAPLRNGDKARLWIKLHRREMIEPAGLWREKVDRGMQPMHAALVALLCRRLGVDRADDEVLALATLVIGPAVHLLVNCEVVDALAPQLLAAPDSVDVWRGRLVRSAETLIAAERRRRVAAARTKARKSRGTGPRAMPGAASATRKQATTVKKRSASQATRTRSRT